MVILLVIIGLSLLIFGHEAGHFLVAKLSGMKVNEFGFGFPPRLLKKKIGETDYSLNLLPFGGFVRIAGENDLPEKGEENISEEEKAKYFHSKPIWKKMCVVLAGVFANVVIGWLLISFIFMVGVAPKVVVGGVEPGSPAEKADIKTGDIILNYSFSKQFIDFVNANRGKEIVLNLERTGKEINLKITPRIKTAPGEGAVGIFLGEAGIERQGFFQSFASGFKETWNVAKETISAFWSMLKSIVITRSIPQGITGPVGIFSMAIGTGKLGFLYFLQLLSLISINLAVLNLIPFPALDGGRFLMLFIEKLKGSPLPKTAEGWINAVGFLLLIALMVIVTIRDVSRL